MAVGLGVTQDPPHRRRAAAAPRPRRPGAACSRGSPGLADLTLTTNGSLLAAKAAAAGARPACSASRSASTRSTTTSSRSLNDVDFPVARVLEGIAAAEARRPGAHQGQHGRPARASTRTSILPMARFARERGYIAALHRVHGRRPHQRLEPRRGRAGAARSWRASMPRCPSSRSPPRYPGEVATRWRYRDGGGEIGVIASVTRALLRRLHPRSPDRRGPALHLPLRGPRHRPARARCGGATSDDGSARRSCAPSGRARATATRSCARRPRRGFPRSRCRASAAESWCADGRTRRLIRMGARRERWRSSAGAHPRTRRERTRVC